MPEYRVIWTIDVDAADPREAAEKARAAQVRPDTTATVFQVKPWGRTTQPPEVVEIDLSPERRCDECDGDMIDGQMIGPWHADTCSLHPFNVVG
jgi:hypothetical protein